MNVEAHATTTPATAIAAASVERMCGSFMLLLRGWQYYSKNAGAFLMFANHLRRGFLLRQGFHLRQGYGGQVGGQVGGQDVEMLPGAICVFSASSLHLPMASWRPREPHRQGAVSGRAATRNEIMVRTKSRSMIGIDETFHCSSPTTSQWPPKSGPTRFNKPSSCSRARLYFTPSSVTFPIISASSRRDAAG